MTRIKYLVGTGSSGTEVTNGKDLDALVKKLTKLGAQPKDIYIEAIEVTECKPSMRSYCVQHEELGGDICVKFEAADDITAVAKVSTLIKNNKYPRNQVFDIYDITSDDLPAQLIATLTS